MDLSSLYDDSMIVDDAITVTLRRQADGETQEVANALKRDATLEDFAQEPAMMEQETTAFHLWAENLAGTVPAKGDKVELIDGSVWHATRVQKLDHGRRFRLACFLERAA